MRHSWSAHPGLQHLWARLLQVTGCLWWARRQLRRHGSVTVLTFHRVLDEAAFRCTCSLPSIVIRRRTFQELADYIATECEAIDIAQAIEVPANKTRVMLTFDDGWKDTYTNAMPALRARGIPATVFVCPGLVGRTLPFWPELVASLMGKTSPQAGGVEIESLIESLKTYTTEDRERFIARLYEMHAPSNGREAYSDDRTVSWDDIREMDASGVRFGCHTHTHQILTNVPAQAARQEIRKSKRAIEAALYKRCDLFAYPNGNSSAATRRILAEEGFAAAFTTQRGAWNGGSDAMFIPRVNICEASVTGPTGRFSTAMFQYTAFWKAWRAMPGEVHAPARPHRETAPRAAHAQMASSNTNLQ